MIIPVLNDRVSLSALLDALTALTPAAWEIVVVDGGSNDGSQSEAVRRGARLVGAEASRGLQLDIGYQASAGGLVWFLHADSRVDACIVGKLQRLHQEVVSSGSSVWGRFDVCLLGAASARSRVRNQVVGSLMNWRSRWTGMCTGDQGIFVSRDLLDAIGGVPRQPLMEDIELSKRLKTQQPPLTLRARLGASARRWETHGFLRTVMLMWQLRLRYFLGASPEHLVARYYS